MRERVSLDGLWDFQIDPNAELFPTAIHSWRQIRVPGPWQAYLPDLRRYQGTAWYRCVFSVPENWRSQAVILHFGAVDYYAEIWVNGQFVGDHEGGYLPFEFEIQEAVRYGDENVLIIRVTDPTDDRGRFPNFPFSEIPHGKQSWYGPVSGLWQSVYLEARDPTHIAALFATPNVDAAQVVLQLELNRPPRSESEIQVLVVSPDGTQMAQATIPCSQEMIYQVALPLSDPILWDVDKPALYRVEASLCQHDTVIDHISENFGMRKIEIREGKLLLNGRCVYLRGVLDQNYYPDTICTPPSEAFLEDDLHKAKELGFNCLRCHIKIPDPRYYAAADRLGLLLWIEVPSWQVLSEEAARRARETLEGMIRLEWNHPSVVIRSIVNEGWGVDLAKEAEHRRWLKEMYEHAKRLDPSRLVVDNSACHGNFHVKSDIDDYHFYRGIPDQLEAWEDELSRFAARPAWTFSGGGDAERKGQEPLIVSEFGNWSLPDVEKLLTHYGGEPWWFNSGQEWGEGTACPQGVFERFRHWHVDRAYPTFGALVEASQAQQFEALKYEIESIRRQASIAGYIVTELTDVHWECNGLLDLLRNLKIDPQHFCLVNANDVIVPVWRRLSFWGGERCEIGVAIAHASRRPVRSGCVEWTLEGIGLRGTLPDVTAEETTVTEVGSVVFTVPELVVPARVRLTLRLIGPDRCGLARNYLDLVFFPQALRAPANRISVGTYGDPTLVLRLANLGYPSHQGLGASLVIATVFDETLQDYVTNGGQALVLAEGKGALQTPPGDVILVERTGSVWEGNWVSTLGWFRRDQIFRTIPGDGRLDLTFTGLIPDHVLTGLRPRDFREEVLAGLLVGWVHQPVALVVRQRVGRGIVLISTFKLLEHLGDHPVATVMMHELITSLRESSL